MNTQLEKKFKQLCGKTHLVDNEYQAIKAFIDEHFVTKEEAHLLHQRGFKNGVKIRNKERTRN